MSYYDEYLERKKKREDDSGNSSYWDGYLERQIKSGRINIHDVISQLSSDYKSWADSLNTYAEKHRSRYQDGNTAYRGDSQEWFDSISSEKKILSDQENRIRQGIKLYGKYINPEWAREVSSSLYSGGVTTTEIYNSAKKDRDYWSQWKTEDDYNTYLWESDFAKAYEAGDYDTAEAMVRDELSRLSSMSPEEMGKQQERLLKLSQYGELVSAGREKALYQPYIEQYGNMSREELINARDALGLAYHNAVSGKPSGADPLGLGKIDTSEMERELKYVNYLINKDDPEVQAAWAAAEEEERKQKEIENAPWWQRTLSTAGDIINRGGYALAQGLETVNDGLGRAFVGAGDFVNDVLDDIGKSSGRRNYNFQWENWKEDYLKGLDYEWAKDTFNIDEDFNTVEDFSYLSEVPELQKTVHGVIDGVGQMAPAIALGLATGGAGAGAAYMSTLAGGSAIDEALKEGADLDQAIVYGQAMAALEGGSEFIGGSVFGEATDLMDTALGRWIVKSGGDKFFGKGIGKAAYTFASEGFEESIMDIATPLAQSAFDIGDAQDTYFGEDWKKGWGEVISGIPETFVVGGAVGSVIEGFHSSVSALTNKDKGGFKYNKIADEMTIIENALKAQEAVKQSKKATPEIIDAFSTKTSEKVSASVQSISETMQKLPPAQRAEVFADAPMLEMFLNEDGGISEGFKYFSAKENVDLLSTVKKVESGSFDPKEKVEFGIVDTNTASRIQTITGVDVTGFKVIIEAQQIEHILRDHGKKGRSDQSMSDSSDISKMEYALQNPDDISLGKSTKAYKNTVDGKTQGAKTVLYEKGIGEKSYYVVQAVPDTKAKTLYVVTAFIGQKGYKNGASQLTNETNLGPTSEIEIANTPVDSISQTGTNVNSKISTELMQYAELAGMGENGVQMMQEVYDGKMPPEKFFEAYNAIYAAGKSRGEARRRDVALLGENVALLGENVAAMARNAGEMDALKGGKSATAYKAGERAAKDAEGGSPPASAVQNSSSLTQHDATPAGAAAIPSGDAQEFKGSVTGKTYSAKAAELLSKAKIGTLDTNRSYYKLDDLGIPKEEQQAWIDAGIAKERPIRGQTVVTVNTTVLKDEVKRREFSSQKVLQNGAESGTINKQREKIKAFSEANSKSLPESVRAKCEGAFIVDGKQVITNGAAIVALDNHATGLKSADEATAKKAYSVIERARNSDQLHKLENVDLDTVKSIGAYRPRGVIGYNNVISLGGKYFDPAQVSATLDIIEGYTCYVDENQASLLYVTGNNGDAVILGISPGNTNNAIEHSVKYRVEFAEDGGSGTIESTQSRRENSDGKEKQHIQDRRRESGVPESQSGTRKEDSRGSRVQSKVGSTKEENPVYASGRPLGLNYDGSETPFNVGDTVEPSEDSDVYVNQQRVINEYGVDCYVIKSDVWESADHDAPAGAYKGKVYVSEDIDPELVATLAPHEGSHIMKQLKFQPYLDFIDNVADMIDRSKIETQKLFEIISEHIGADVLGEMDPGRFYDEMNASIYGFYKAGMMESTGFGELVSEAFYDFDAYIAELDAIHEQYKQEVKAKRDSSGTHPTDTSADPDVQQAKSDQASSSEWSAERIEGGKAEKARPVSEIIEQIRHDFGINITKGHVRGKGVLGQYSKRNHGIRTKIANDLPTVAHELGHALDQRYGLTDNSKLTKEMRSELVNALGDLKGSYKQNLWVSEGLAEYMRRFLQNRDDAARMYPEFTRHFLSSLSKADRVLIDTFADEINAYYALDGDTATSSIRLREEGVPDARTPLEKARDMGDGVYQAWVDANHGIRLFDEATGANTYKLASNAAYSDAIAGQIITGDLTDANGQYVAPGLKAALEGVNIGDKKIYREFGEYLVLRHGPERLGEGMRIFADERKNNAAFMEKRAGELEAAHPEFKEAADRLYTFQKQFLKTWAIDTGLLPSEVAEEWAKRWSFYVPLNRAVGKAGTVGAKRGYANQNSTVRKAIGSGLDIVHPVDNIINNIVKMVNAGVRNNVMLEITAQAKAVGADATFLEEVPTPMKKKTADLTGVKAKLHDAFGAAGIGELLAEVEGEIAKRNKPESSDVEMAKAYGIEITGKQLEDNAREVVSMSNVSSLTGTEFESDGKTSLKEKVISFFNNLGNKVQTKEIGEVALTKTSFSDDKGHGLTRNKIVSFSAIPEVLRNGRVIDVYKPDGKPYIRITIAAPIEIAGEKYYMGVMVQKDNQSNRMYLHDVITEKATLSLSNGANHQNSEGIRDEGHLFITSILQKRLSVNYFSKKNIGNGVNGKSDTWSKVDEIIESAIDDVLIQYGQGKAHGDVVTVLRNGKQEFWKINDALLLESLTNLSQKKMNGIMEAYAVVSRFMTSNITGNNIIWSIFSNFPRDMMTFFTYSKQKNPLKSFPAMGEAYLNKVTGGNAETKNLPYIKEYYALGGGQTSAYTADVDLAKRARKKLKHSTKLQSAAYYANPLNVLSFVSETVESGPRIATYIMMREKGMSPQDAFYESQDITVNFKRGGRLSREFNKAVPFFNASVQGLDKFKRWITCADVPKAQRAKAIVGRVTMYVAVSAALGALIYALNNGDDEDEENYRLLSNYTKNTYWNIPLGDGKYFAIPKPREIAVLSTFIETTCEYFGGNDYSYDEFGDYVADNFLPPFLSDLVTDGMDGALGSLGIIGVAFHLGANKDFLGRPIESTSLQGYESQDRYTRRTSQIAYWLGQAAAELGLDWSPVQIDYFFSQVLGGYWKVQKALFPVGSENVDWTLGVQNTYVKDNQYSNDIVNWMYDKSTSSAQAAKSHPEDTDIAIEAKLDGDMESFYSRYYALTKGQKEDAAARRAKRVVLDMIVEYRKASDNGDESETQKVIYDLIDRCHDTSLLPSVMQTKVKDADGNEHSLRDYQYVEYQTTYNALYWGYVEDNLGGVESDAEMIAIIKKAQTIAKERATQKALESVGAGSSGYFEKYPGIDDSDLITFQAQMDIETDKDGGLSQEELIDILEKMVADGLSREDAYTLFKSRYPTSDKNNPWRSYAP